MSKYWIVFEGYLNWQVQNGSHLTAARVNHNICKVFLAVPTPSYKENPTILTEKNFPSFFSVEIEKKFKMQKCFVFVQIVNLI